MTLILGTIACAAFVAALLYLCKRASVQTEAEEDAAFFRQRIDHLELQASLANGAARLHQSDLRGCRRLLLKVQAERDAAVAVVNEARNFLRGEPADLARAFSRYENERAKERV